jgi:hypothetical protein
MGKVDGSARAWLRLGWLVWGVAAVLIVVGGCGGPAAGDPTEPEGVGVSSLSQGLVLPDPNGAYFASVVANGSGCPAGTWDASIDPSGETFTITFSQYETFLNPGQLISIKDCQIGVKLHSPHGLSFALASFYYSGYAFLDSSGMSATQTARYYFQGNPVNNTGGRTELVGPYDDAYVFQDDVGLPDLVWQPCGTDRMLNIPTRIIAKNNWRRTGTGYVNTLAADGSVALQFRLAWRTCP